MPRPIAALPKAHLHLHFTGSMRHGTLVELAALHGVHLPEALAGEWPPQLSGADERGWFRFQRLYDIARSVLRTEADVRRLLAEAAADEQAEGSGWLEMQIDPSGYAGRFGGLTSMLELVLSAAADAAQTAGIGVGIIVAANRTRHPLDARTLARLATAYADQGVVGFGLSSDERRGAVADFAGLPDCREGRAAFGPARRRTGWPSERASMPGRAARRPDRSWCRSGGRSEVARQACCQSGDARGLPDVQCGARRGSNGSRRAAAELLHAGIPVALGADDPLLFGPRLSAQYELARHVHGMSDEDLAELARMSIVSSAAPVAVQKRLLAGIDQWLAAPPV